MTNEDLDAIEARAKKGCYQVSNADVLSLLVLVRQMAAELEEWRECAKYDALMEGPKFKGWDRSALDRLRRKYEALAH